MNLLRAAAYVRTPWKNGGGSTLEVCRDQGTGLDGFGWRLSIADIDQGGPFSSFVGYERIITVLEGNGMTLRVDGASSGPLGPFEPFAFAGASQVTCELTRGPIRDFNLIYAPDRYSARLHWHDGETPLPANPQALRVIFAAAPRVHVETGGNTLVLGRYDTLLLPPAIAAQVSGCCCVIHLTAL